MHQKPCHAVKMVTGSAFRALGDEHRKNAGFNLIKVQDKSGP